jgi:hypothetical protein
MDPKKAIYQFKVRLKEIEPEIWRRIVVPASYSFWDLHVAIQDSMGWSDYHLHAFRVKNPETNKIDAIGIPDDEAIGDGVIFLAGWETPIANYFVKPGDEAEYEYDFGDDWEHVVFLEKIDEIKPKTKYPKCIDGNRACPPEDCGGPGGYEDMLTIMLDENHEQHEEIIEWLGGIFNPEEFDPKDIKFDNPKKRWEQAFKSN